jgi:hypothetical protein
MMLIRLGIFAVLLMGALSCGTTFLGGPGADGGPSGGSGRSLTDGGPAEEGTIEIYVQGELTPKVFSDGLSGQTPEDYVMGLSRFDLMRSATDPAPVTAFDHGARSVEVDMLGRTLAGTARTAEIPTGVYAYGRVLLTMTRFTVRATAHGQGLSLPGKLKVTGALSDTTLDGQPWTKGQAQYTFTAGGLFSRTMAGPLPPLPSTAGGGIVPEGGRTWLVFPFPTPLAVDPHSRARHQATIIYEVFDSFRWEDQAGPGYSSGVFDIAETTFEPVRNFGATGYRIEAQ